MGNVARDWEGMGVAVGSVRSKKRVGEKDTLLRDCRPIGDETRQ